MIQIVEIIGVPGSGKSTMRRQLHGLPLSKSVRKNWVDCSLQLDMPPPPYREWRVRIIKKMRINFVKFFCLSIYFIRRPITGKVSLRTMAAWIRSSLGFFTTAQSLGPGEIGIYDEGPLTRAITCLGTNASDQLLSLWCRVVPLPDVFLWHTVANEQIEKVFLHRFETGTLPKFMKNMTLEEAREQMENLAKFIPRLVAALPPRVRVVERPEEICAIVEECG